MATPRIPGSPTLAMFTTVAMVAALASSSACTPERGYHPESDVPENQARVHKPDYRGGELAPGELEPPETPPAPVYEPEPEPSEPDVPPAWRITAVVIDHNLAQVCGIDAAKTHFDYDSAKLDAEARQRVDEVAECFLDGPLRGRDVVVIGHADPRGTDAYNRELGMSRAESVAAALTREGLAATRIDLESHGEAEAHADPDEWPDDRRVELHVAK